VKFAYLYQELSGGKKWDTNRKKRNKEEGIKRLSKALNTATAHALSERKMRALWAESKPGKSSLA